jgi:hypothetical protein
MERVMIANVLSIAGSDPSGGAGIQADPPKYRWRGEPLNAGWVTTFNRHAVVSENRCTKVPADTNPDAAALFGCAITTGFGVGTLEYRYLLGRNSFLYAFTDLGWAEDRSSGPVARHFYAGAGVGMSFETRAGLFNLAYAAGKRDDLPFDIRQSKIHFGLVSLF